MVSKRAILFISIIQYCAPTEQADPIKAPGPLFTFGQNILPASQSVIGYRLSSLDQDNSAFTRVDLGYIYGVHDRLSVELVLPIILKDKRSTGIKTHGLGSLILQGEGMVYEKNDTNFLHQVTLLASIFFPSATTSIQTFLSVKAFEYFLGTTNSIVTNDWYFYSAFGGIITTEYQNQQLPHRFLYDLGCGIKFNEKDTSYLASILELTGFYSGNTQSQDIVFPHSNVIFIGPSLRYANQDYIIQVGFQYPFTQRNIPKEEHLNYRGALLMAWRFGR